MHTGTLCCMHGARCDDLLMFVCLLLVDGGTAADASTACQQTYQEHGENRRQPTTWPWGRHGLILCHVCDLCARGKRR